MFGAVWRFLGRRRGTRDHGARLLSACVAHSRPLTPSHTHSPLISRPRSALSRPWIREVAILAVSLVFLLDLRGSNPCGLPFVALLALPTHAHSRPLAAHFSSVLCAFSSALYAFRWIREVAILAVSLVFLLDPRGSNPCGLSFLSIGSAG